MIERQQNLEASSSQKTEEKDLDIREKYKQIKKKNEEIKNEIYFQHLKQTPSVQNKLLSAFDYSNKNLTMLVLQPTVKTPKIVADYKKVDLEVQTEKIHALDQIEFHRNGLEMLYSTITTKVMSFQKIQNTIINMKDQMKVEKASLYDKDLRIKSLEELVIQVGYDPANFKVAKGLVKKKNVDIAALRKIGRAHV